VQDPGVRLRDIGEAVGITERAAHRIVGELTDAGYVSRDRVGRRNHYMIQITRLPPFRLRSTARPLHSSRPFRTAGCRSPRSRRRRPADR
jgi:DNA-binding IclR family transcriptional regulator